MGKVLSVRLNEEDEQRLKVLAEELAIGPSVLARMVLHSSLATLEAFRVARETDRFPLSLLSELLAPAARVKGLTEEDLTRSVKASRKRLWEERYALWKRHGIQLESLYGLLCVLGKRERKPPSD